MASAAAASACARPNRPVPADAGEEALHKEGAKAVRKEGLSEAHWVLLDFGDIVVHVQHAEDRVYYALERLLQVRGIVNFKHQLP